MDNRQHLAAYCAFYFLLGLALPLLVAYPAQAHDPSEFNARKWPQATYQAGITVWIDDSVPGGLGGNWTDRVQDGFQTWNALCCVDGFVFFSGTSVLSRSYGVCHTDRDFIIFHENFSGALAETGYCDNDVTGKPYYMATRFDPDRTWYTGADTPIPDEKFDAQSVATHEFGHGTATWWDNAHFTSPISCPGNNADQTMCSGTGKGQGKKRNLEEHDKDTFQNNY